MTTSMRPASPAETDRPAGGPAEAADAYVRALAAHGVDCLFLNPGTDTIPIQEALSKLEQQGVRVPRTILCPFELVALAAAHAYYAATGRPQAVLVHVDVGTQNLGGMVHNAQRGRAAVLICAGRTPYTADPRQRGARDTYIHWLQEQFDQHGIVRSFVKWEYEVRRPDQMVEAVGRAFQIAKSDPPGPVYLTLPREVLMTDIPPPAPAALRPAASARIGAGDPDALREVAERLVRAVRPLVITSTTGRSRQGFEALVRLAELLALPVVERRDRTNFPTTHPLHQGFDVRPILESADLVLVLDADVPYIPTMTGPPAEAAIVQIDLDPVKERIPLWNFPLTLAVRADTSRALPLLAEYVPELLTEPARQVIETRRAILARLHHERRAARRTATQALRDQAPIAPEWVGQCIADLQREAPDCVFVDETVTSYPAVWNHLDLTEPETMYGSCGSALGWGVGAAVGVKLARPDRTVIALVGDGSFMFGDPLAALWASQANRAPILVVVFNNRRYNATRMPLVGAYPQGHSVRGNHFVGVDLTPSARYDLLAAVVGAAGERVEAPDQVLPALRRALEQVRGGKSAIVDVLIA